MKAIIKKGEEIDFLELSKILSIWRKTFHSKYVEIKDKKSFSKNIFFILKENKKIIAVGRLIPVKIVFMNECYEIMGIADVVSVIRGRGYGKKLMKHIKKYLTVKKQIGIGFCKGNNSEFYKKCKFKIFKNLSNRFVFRKKMKKIRDEWIYDDVIYNSHARKLIKKIEQKSEENIFIPLKHW